MRIYNLTEALRRHYGDKNRQRERPRINETHGIEVEAERRLGIRYRPARESEGN